MCLSMSDITRNSCLCAVYFYLLLFPVFLHFSFLSVFHIYPLFPLNLTFFLTLYTVLISLSRFTAMTIGYHLTSEVHLSSVQLVQKYESLMRSEFLTTSNAVISLSVIIQAIHMSETLVFNSPVKTLIFPIGF
jgi:hypothetical protein